MTPTRALLVDDHALVRAGIRALIESMPAIEVVGEASDGHEALERVEELDPDLIILDVSMKGLNGIEVLRRLQKRQVKTLVVTMHSGEEFLARALRAGASGYLLKEAAENELKLAIESVLAGRQYLSPAVSGPVLEAFLSREASDNDPAAILSPRQREILQLIAEGMSTRGIAEHLGVSVKTVETHRGHIMARLGIKDVPSLVRFAIRNGLIEA